MARNANASLALLSSAASLAILLVVGGGEAKATTGVFELVVVDHDSREPIACRMHLRTSTGKMRKVSDTPFWNDHFVVPGRLTLKLPLGTYVFEMERGPEYLDRSGHFTINRFADDSKTVDLRRFVDMSEYGWWAGDLDVRRPLKDIELLMQAEDLHIAEVVTWWNGKTEQDAPVGQDAQRLMSFDGNRFYHALAGGHERPGGTWLFFNLFSPLLLDATREEFPPPTLSLEEAQSAADAWIDVALPTSWDLPMLVANGQIESVQIAYGGLCRDTIVPIHSGGKPRDRLRYPGNWGDGRWAQDVYFRLLDCGIRIPPSAGSGSGRTPNPVGYNRVYAHVEGELTYEKWFRSLHAGQVTVTNGPLLRPSVEGQLPGYVFHGETGRPLELEIALTMSTRDKISYLEIIKDGIVEHSVPLDDYAKTGKLPKVVFDGSGWFLVRAVTDLQDTYRFAMTGPYYVEYDYRPRISRQSAQFFLDWVYERARQLQVDDLERRRQLIEPWRKARDFWQDMVDRANAE